MQFNVKLVGLICCTGLSCDVFNFLVVFFLWMQAAITIIEKILDIDVGFIHVITSREQLFEVVHGLSLTVSDFQLSYLPILKIAIKCFSHLA